MVVGHREHVVEVVRHDHHCESPIGKPADEVEHHRAIATFERLPRPIHAVRGELDIESTAGRGTTVIAWVPA